MVGAKPQISPQRVEVLSTFTHEVPWLLSHCLCNTAAAAAVSSHSLSSGEKHEICSIQRTRQKIKTPSLSSFRLLSGRVCLSHSAAAPIWTQLAPQGGPISRLNGPLWCRSGAPAHGGGGQRGASVTVLLLAISGKLQIRGG